MLCLVGVDCGAQGRVRNKAEPTAVNLAAIVFGAWLDYTAKGGETPRVKLVVGMWPSELNEDVQANARVDPKVLIGSAAKYFFVSCNDTESAYLILAIHSVESMDYTTALALLLALRL